MGNRKSCPTNECYHTLEYITPGERDSMYSTCWIKTPGNIKSYSLSKEECNEHCENDHQCVGTFIDNMFTTFRKENMYISQGGASGNRPSWANTNTQMNCDNLMINGYGNGIIY